MALLNKPKNQVLSAVEWRTHPYLAIQQREEEAGRPSRSTLKIIFNPSICWHWKAEESDPNRNPIVAFPKHEVICSPEPHARAKYFIVVCKGFQ